MSIHIIDDWQQEVCRLAARSMYDSAAIVEKLHPLTLSASKLYADRTWWEAIPAMSPRAAWRTIDNCIRDLSHDGVLHGEFDAH